jgi:Putative Flp pilus-assembly TadE/G-like/von Willebrand factor type A domain
MRAWLLNMCRDRSGTTLVTFALTLAGMMLAIGAGVDIGRWLFARDDTLAAVDAAVLAGARTLQTSKDEAAAISVAQYFYNVNVSSRLPVKNDSISFAVVDSGQAVVASGNAQIDTIFLRLADVPSLPLIPAAVNEIAKAEFAVGGHSVTGSGDESEPESLEISLMLDVTGSMKGQKLDDLKSAAKDLIGIVLWESSIENNSRIALVPFSEDIRLPTTSSLEEARGTGLPSSKTLTSGYGSHQQSKKYYLSDCVVERAGTHAYTDATPDPGQYVMAHYTSSTTGSGSNKKGECTIPAGAEVMPLTGDRTALLDKVEGLSASGGTAGHLGTVWAWFTLSPYWSSLWPTKNDPGTYGKENLQKIAILMTDGEYNTEYDSNGVKVGSTGAGPSANDDSTTQALALCAAMKQNDNVIVYAVGFDLPGEASKAYQTLYNCASDPKKKYFYNATDGTQLKNAFRDIAIKISSPLVLSK